MEKDICSECGEINLGAQQQLNWAIIEVSLAAPLPVVRSFVFLCALVSLVV